MARELIFQVTKKDLEIDYFSGTGAGGQHRNKHMNCVRIKHIPTGIMTQCQSHRERAANFREAFQKLAKLVVDDFLAKEKTDDPGRNTEVVRTYHAVDNRVVDHASGEQFEYSKTVGKGDISELIKARWEAEMTTLLEEIAKEDPCG